ncbi:hypothetical protein IE81DRAFT_320594 [Ceraceosorus guamensis]|uniref:Uncharacterized protein n=1 Tax=Ceraceosorus guamensis TaxID=1522189 RepID=A0A316W515_9BASI|nr:hypothetical protein IE81DRAFT_320594 [Ceraceosorus guamensis]PWN45000.1 hypothetical protein IE81DRAFT_320594 [Ceraceosorus guamensis]
MSFIPFETALGYPIDRSIWPPPMRQQYSLVKDAFLVCALEGVHPTELDWLGGQLCVAVGEEMDEEGIVQQASAILSSFTHPGQLTAPLVTIDQLCRAFPIFAKRGLCTKSLGSVAAKCWRWAWNEEAQYESREKRERILMDVIEICELHAVFLYPEILRCYEENYA